MSLYLLLKHFHPLYQRAGIIFYASPYHLKKKERENSNDNVDVDTKGEGGYIGGHDVEEQLLKTRRRTQIRKLEIASEPKRRRTCRNK